MTGLFGSVFDPPHNGHVAVVRSAREHFDLDRLVVLVVADPGHKAVVTGAAERLALARLAFSGDEVELDTHPRTVDMLRERRFDDPLFLVGADEFCDFLDWKEPNGVLELARLGVATRPGYPRDRLDRVLERLDRPDRVAFFDIEPLDIASRDIRALVAGGKSISDLVPEPVAGEIARLGLYRRDG